MQPDKKDQKINPMYIMAWCAFLLVPALTLYTGWKHHSTFAIIASLLAIAGFLTLIFIAVKHNRKIREREARGNDSFTEGRL